MSPHEPIETTSNPGYERRDVRISALLWLGLTVFLGSAAVFIVLWLLLLVLERQARKADPQPSPLAETEAMPPAPRLQEMPVEDLQTLVQRDETILTTYGWVDEQKQTVRIPVSRAIELVLERGLPTPAPQKDSSPQKSPDSQETSP